MASNSLSRETELSLAAEAIGKAQLVLVLLDPIDFAGTLVPELFRKAKGKAAVVLTKMDLLPPIARHHEVVAWVKEELGRKGIEPVRIFPVSSKNGQGIPELLSFLEKRKAEEIALVGATNVGKSALLARLLPNDAQEPTISNLKGTTQGLNIRKWEHGKLIDTPGITPLGRLDQFICPRCQVELIPADPIKSRLYQLASGQALLFGALGYVENLENETVLQVYVPGSVILHRTTGEKAQKLLAAKPHWLSGSSCKCPTGAWETREVSVQPLEDLAIAGLGWLSVRRAPASLRLVLPQGVQIQVRNALLQKR